MQEQDSGDFVNLGSYSPPPPLTDAEKFVVISRGEIASYKQKAKVLANSQEWFAQALDAINAVIFISELNGFKIIFANKAARSMLGENANLMQCWKILHPNQPSPCKNCPKTKPSSGDTTDAQACGEQFAFARDKWFKTSSQLIIWPPGQPAWLTFASDISGDILAQKQANDAKELLRQNAEELAYLHEENSRLQKDAEKSSKHESEWTQQIIGRKDSFVRQLGHDLKVTMTPILSAFPKIIADEADPQKKETLKVIFESFQHMRQLTDKTLELAKLSAANMTLSFEPICLRDVVDQVIASFRLSQRLKGCTFINALSSDVRPEVDRIRIREVFENLFNNAFNYSNGQNMVQVSAQQADRMLVVSVKDSGIGMTQEQLAKMFDEFYRANPASHHDESLGLGLSICKKIIELHGGSIWAASEGINKGVTVFFSLPM